MNWMNVDEIISNSLEGMIISAKEPLSQSQAKYHANKLSLIKNKFATVYVKKNTRWRKHPAQEVSDVRYSENSKFGGLLKNRLVPFNVIKESVDIILQDFSIIIPLSKKTFSTRKWNIHQYAPRYFIGNNYLAMKVPSMMLQDEKEMDNYVLIFTEPLKQYDP